jgi:N4-gp56 family major capsid protein
MANNTTINAELFSNLVTAAQFAAYEQSVARQMATVFDAPMNSGKVLQVPVWTSIAAQNISNEAAATAAATGTDQALITMTEHVVYHQITDMLRDSATNNVIAQLGDQSGRAIAESMDIEFMSKFAALGTLGGLTDVTINASAFDKNDIMNRVAQLRAAKLTGPFYAVVHPTAANEIKKALTANDSYTASGAVADSILTDYFVGQLAGCRIIESANVPLTGDVATCAVFAPSAIGHAMRGAVSLEQDRNAPARATDLVMTGVAGSNVLQETHGVKLSIDLSA